MQCIVHDPARVPDPKNCAFFPKRKQGQVAPIQPRKMVNKTCGHFHIMQVNMTFQYYTIMHLMMALPIAPRHTAAPNK